MKVVETYSHLNGLEYLMVHKPGLWQEIQDVIAAVDAQSFKTKVSAEKTMMGKLLYAPKEMNAAMNAEFKSRGWHESRTSYWVTKDAKVIRRTMALSPKSKRTRLRPLARCLSIPIIKPTS